MKNKLLSIFLSIGPMVQVIECTETDRRTDRTDNITSSPLHAGHSDREWIRPVPGSEKMKPKCDMNVNNQSQNWHFLLHFS